MQIDDINAEVMEVIIAGEITNVQNRHNNTLFHDILEIYVA